MNGIPETYHGKPLIHVWPYLDQTGELIGQVARYGTDKKEIIPFFKWDGSGWKAGIDQILRSLFGLELLSGPMKPKAVFIVEGEKSAAPLQKHRHCSSYLARRFTGGKTIGLGPVKRLQNGLPTA